MIGACSPRSYLLTAGWLILTPFVLAGCGPQHAIVEGQITVDGHPANSGRVFFRSADEKSVIFAYIQPDGAYQAVDVPLGPMTVWITPLTKLERAKLQRTTA